MLPPYSPLLVLLSLFGPDHPANRHARNDPTSLNRRDRPVLPKGRLHFRQPFHRSLGTPVIILRQRLPRGLALMIPQRHRHNFFLQTPRLVRIVRTLLGTQRKLILHLARNLMLRAVQLCAVWHPRPAIRT